MAEEIELFKEIKLPEIRPEDIPIVRIAPLPHEIPIAMPVTTPPPPPPPIEVEPINEVEYDETTDTGYKVIIRLMPKFGKVILLDEIAIAPLDTNSITYGRYYWRIDDKTWSEVELKTTMNLQYNYKIYAKEVIEIGHRTIDPAYTVKTQALISGIEITEEDIPKIRGFQNKFR